MPENDAWWGPGFTEWTNVTRARPLYRGHRQPHLPADLGFYDLRVAETRQAQAELARAAGVEAFCYWHYWFGDGRRILERPFAEVLAGGEPDLSFCLGWANQSWTGTWHGAPDRVLVDQHYPGPDDDRRHFEAVLPAFHDPRYLRVDGRPVFYVFRPEQVPDVRAWTDRWRDLAARAGLPGLYLVAEQSDLLGRGVSYSLDAGGGFDAGVYVRLPVTVSARTTLAMRVRRRLGQPERYPYASRPVGVPPQLAGPRVHPCVYPNWDNTPRSARRGLVLDGASPAAFATQVEAAVEAIADRDPEQRFLFVKSWNEWAEGNHLEPDQVDGHGYLDALARSLGVPSP